MLKNKNEREQYIQSEENWIVIGSINDVVELLKLKNTDIYRVRQKYHNYHFGTSWNNQFGYLIIEKFEEGIQRTLTKTEVLNYIKDLKNEECE